MEQPKFDTAQIIEDVVKNASTDRILIRDLIESMHASGFGLTMMLFAMGVLIPLPPPIPSIISLPLVVFAIQMVMGCPSPRLPKRFANLSIKRSILATIVQKTSPHLRRAERVLRPRLLFMLSPVFERIIGCLILVFSFSISLPVPFTNFIPGVGILLISFGMIGKDGLVVICGIIIGMIGVSISAVVIMLGVEVIQYINNFLINLF